ncbi:MAG: DciA family protein [Thiobacillaceae bacterium]|jgi:hypothetical protein
MTASKSVGELLSSPVQGNVLARGHALLALQAKLDKLLPESFRGQVFVADLKDGILSVACAHSGLASRLRSEGPRLAKALTDEGLATQQIKIMVRPDLPLYRGPETPKIGLSQKALATLSKAEQELESGELKSVLGRMIRRHKT